MIDFDRIIEYAILLFCWWLFVDVPHDFMVRHYSKKCSYDCSSCKAWDCMGKECNDRRNKL